ncbi:MAG: DUF192 domain-containing protein [Elusimicrobiaceae bacterium]|nr:DUF192 domain-containing protein [Elusimicrobiaceae bacterium]
MSKKYFLYFIFWVLAFGFTGCKSKTITVILPDNFKVKAELALTKSEAETGLMHRKNLPEGRGMLFVFNKETPHYFWMKNTFVDLDMLFIGENKTVNQAWENVPRSYVYTPDNQVAVRGGMAKYVLELPAKSITKHKIKSGSRIDFNEEKIDYSLVEK